MMGFGIGFGLLFMLLFLGVLVVGAIWLVKAVFSGERRTLGSAAGGEPRPRDVLDQRYARGELAREEYDRIRQDLEA
jgi:putative membrane protein